MILAKCYYVDYYVADFSAKNETTIHHEDFYQDYNNALLVAKELVKCLDVVDYVYVIDGLTGEILNTVSKAAPKEDEIEDSIPTFTDTFEDKNGGIWRLMEDGKWDYDCTNFCCLDCIYCNNDNGLCNVVDPLSEKDRDYQIELANKRIGLKADKNDAINDESFEDGFGGIWYKDADNELWSYNCYGISCHECPYDYDAGCGWCHTTNLSLDNAKKRIAEAKERIGK